MFHGKIRPFLYLKQKSLILVYGSYIATVLCSIPFIIIIFQYEGTSVFHIYPVLSIRSTVETQCHVRKRKATANTEVSGEVYGLITVDYFIAVFDDPVSGNIFHRILFQGGSVDLGTGVIKETGGIKYGKGVENKSQRNKGGERTDQRPFMYKIARNILLIHDLHSPRFLNRDIHRPNRMIIDYGNENSSSRGIFPPPCPGMGRAVLRFFRPFLGLVIHEGEVFPTFQFRHCR